MVYLHKLSTKKLLIKQVSQQLYFLLDLIFFHKLNFDPRAISNIRSALQTIVIFDSKQLSSKQQQFKLKQQKINMLFSNEQQSQEHSSFNRTKRQRFRKEIRKSYISDKMMEIRSKLVDELTQEQFKQTIRALNNRFDLTEFQTMVDILDKKNGDCDFHLKFAQEKFEEMVINLIMSHKNQVGKTSILRVIIGLTYFTFYSSNSAKKLIQRQDFIDYLRRDIQELDMRELQDLNFFNNSVNLLMNLSSEKSNDFNLYLAESDICRALNKKLAQTVNYSKIANQSYLCKVYKIRESTLRFFKNVVKSYNCNPSIFAGLMAEVIEDEQNLKNHTENVFSLLSSAMANQDFFKILISPPREHFYKVINQSIAQVQKRCFNKGFLYSAQDTLTKQQFNSFYGIIQFLNSLFYEPEQLQVSWELLIEETFNGYMLAEFLFEAHRQRKKEQTVEALRLYSHLSATYSVGADELIIVRPAEQDKFALVKMFANQQLIKGQATGFYCLQILSNLLLKDRKYLADLMQLRIIDKILLIFQDKLPQIPKAIKLVKMLINSEEESQDGRRMIKIMQNKGIIGMIEKLVEDNDRKLYLPAQTFTQFLAQKRKTEQRI